MTAYYVKEEKEMIKVLSTVRGKKFALKKLEERRKRSRTEEKINNSNLPEGSLMYYYCTTCGCVADILPELHNNLPKGLCDECQALKDAGWLE